MKKTITFLLLICLCVSLCSCTPEAGQTVETITLSEDNWRRYLCIEKETQNYVCNEVFLGTTYATADCVINVFKSTQCSFSNVVIRLEVYSATVCWQKETKTIELKVSADGYATKRVSFTSERMIPGCLPEPFFNYRIISVSGTVQVKT